MLILCCGPDTFRASRKARELERAFREKYDPAGTSIENVSGKQAVDSVIEKTNTTSLFSPRRFLRAQNLLAGCPKQKLDALAKALSQEPEYIITVSVEDVPPKASVLKPFEKTVKLISYDFPEMKGAEFFRFVQGLASELGVEDQTVARGIAEACEGDAWFAWNELVKSAAGGHANRRSENGESSIFEQADAFLQSKPFRHGPYANGSNAKELNNIIFSQSRSALRVRDDAASGIHPYVQKKLGRLALEEAESLYGASLMSFILTRKGWSSDDETAALLP